MLQVSDYTCADFDSELRVATPSSSSSGGGAAAEDAPAAPAPAPAPAPHAIYVTKEPLFTEAECAEVVAAANAYMEVQLYTPEMASRHIYMWDCLPSQCVHSRDGVASHTCGVASLRAMCTLQRCRRVTCILCGIVTYLWIGLPSQCVRRDTCRDTYILYIYCVIFCVGLSHIYGIASLRNVHTTTTSEK